MKLYSYNIFPILQVAKRYQLDSERLFSILMNFLSHRREEILNAQLSKWFSPFDADIKRDLRPILYQLINELDYSDNVEDYFIKNSYFYIKDHPHESDDDWYD
jgi:hypothetical protein